MRNLVDVSQFVNEYYGSRLTIAAFMADPDATYRRYRFLDAYPIDNDDDIFERPLALEIYGDKR